MVELKSFIETALAANSVVVVTILALFFVGVATLMYVTISSLSGWSAKLENAMCQYNDALAGWAIYASREELQNYYPVRIEVDAEKTPFGLHVKRLVVVVKPGQGPEKRYLRVRQDEHFVLFQEVSDDECE